MRQLFSMWDYLAVVIWCVLGGLISWIGGWILNKFRIGHYWIFLQRCLLICLLSLMIIPLCSRPAGFGGGPDMFARFIAACCFFLSFFMAAIMLVELPYREWRNPEAWRRWNSLHRRSGRIYEIFCWILLLVSLAALAAPIF